MNKSCNKKLNTEDIRRAIRSMGNNKSPGPDGIPAEFYKLFEDLVAGELVKVIEEARQ